MSKVLKKDKFLVIIGGLGIFLAAFFVRLLLLLNTANYFPKWEDISASKILEAQLPPTFEVIWSTVLPLYPLLLRSVNLLGGDYLVFAPWLSLFFGAMSVLLLFFLLKKVFNLEIAFFASWLMAFYPICVIQSVLSTEMTFFLFTVLLGFISYYNYLEKRNIKDFILLCLFLNASSLIRPEGWVIGFVCVFCIFFNASFVISLRLLFFGNIAFLYNFFQGKILEYIVSQKTTSVYEIKNMVESGQLDSNSFNALMELMHNILPSFVLFVGVFAFFCFSANKRYWLFLATFSSIFCLFLYRIVTFSMHPHPRYFSILFVLFVPFLFLGLFKIVKSAKFRLIVESLLAVFMTVYFLNFNLLMYRDTLPSIVEVIKNPIAQPQEVTLVADWVMANVSKNSKILVDYPDNPRFFLSVVTLLGKKDYKITVLFPETLVNSGDQVKKMRKNIFFLDPDIILLYKDGFFLKIFDNFKIIKSLDYVFYEKRFSASNFTVWEKQKK